MSDYSIDDPTLRIADLVARVREGETVVLTEGGKPVAEVKAAAEVLPPKRAMTEADWEWLRQRRETRKININAVDLVRQMRDEGN